MKKFLSIMLLVLLVFSSCVGFADDDISILLNGQNLATDVAPVIVNNRTMIPFRVIFEALGAEVNWSDSLKKAYATTSDGLTIILTVSSTKMVVDSSVTELDAAPFIMDNRVLVPVRAVCEALKCTVDWNPDTRTVIIKTLDYTDKVYNETIGGDPAYIKKDGEFDKELLELINAKRNEMGLSVLENSDALKNVALSHSSDMASRDYIDHTSPDGVGPFDRIDAAGIAYVAAAENIASGFATAQKVFDSWLASPKHYANLMNSEFNKIGIGYYAGGTNGTYWTIVLISD